MSSKNNLHKTADPSNSSVDEMIEDVEQIMQGVAPDIYQPSPEEVAPKENKKKKSRKAVDRAASPPSP